MTFTTMNLTNDRVLVKGSDVHGGHGETILDASQWVELGQRSALRTAQADFDAAVDAFFAPLTEAAEKASKTVERPTDSSAFVVLDEGTEGQQAVAPVIVSLTKDSIVLRLIEEGNTDRLVWVGDELEVLEVLPNTHQSVAPATGNGDPHQRETGLETADGPFEVSPQD